MMKSKPSIYLIPIVIVALISFVLIYSATQLKQGETKKSFQFLDRKVPEFNIANLNDDQASIDQTVFEVPKLQLAVFFASWCVPCVAELPMLRILSDEGFSIYGISWRDKLADTKEWLSKHQPTYQHAGIGHEGIGADWGITGVPETFFIYNGRIVYHHKGVIDRVFLDDAFPKIAAFVTNKKKEG